MLMRGVRAFLVVRDSREGGGDGEMEREVSTRREERETVYSSRQQSCEGCPGPIAHRISVRRLAGMVRPHAHSIRDVLNRGYIDLRRRGQAW